MYIDGYLANSTDIEMKRTVTLAGGEALSAHPSHLSLTHCAEAGYCLYRYTASRATHILTSQQLSGSKTHKILTGRCRDIVHVVRPEWVTDSIAAGKRLPERAYAVLPTGSTRKITDEFGVGSSRDVPIELE